MQIAVKYGQLSTLKVLSRAHATQARQQQQQQVQEQQQQNQEQQQQQQLQQDEHQDETSYLGSASTSASASVDTSMLNKPSTAAPDNDVATSFPKDSKTMGSVIEKGGKGSGDDVQLFGGLDVLFYNDANKNSKRGQTLRDLAAHYQVLWFPCVLAGVCLFFEGNMTW